MRLIIIAHLFYITKLTAVDAAASNNINRKPIPLTSSHLLPEGLQTL